MKVSLNLTKLKGNKLTPSEFVYMLIKSESGKQLEKYLEILPIDESKLEKRGFIKIMPDNSLTLRQKRWIYLRYEDVKIVGINLHWPTHARIKAVHYTMI